MDPVYSLYKYGTRYYDPTLGRWTQQDPVGGSLGNLNSANRYVYAGDDPVNVVDPSGTVSVYCVFSAIVGILAALGGGATVMGAVIQLGSAQTALQALDAATASSLAIAAAEDAVAAAAWTLGGAIIGVLALLLALIGVGIWVCRNT